MKLKKPTRIPTPASEFAYGWWCGIGAGIVNGMALAVLFGWLR